MLDPVSTPESRAELTQKLGTVALRSRRDGGVHVIELAGEVDIANAPEIEEELKRVEATDAEAIIVDLSGLDFIDSSGLRLLVMANARSRADSGRLTLLRPRDAIFRVFTMSGTAAVLPFAD
jgi:anti-sigma B factor antagonist